MSTIFTALADALGPWVGGTDVAGAILGISTITIFMAGFTIMFGKEFMKTPTGLVLMLIVVCFVSIPTIVAWFPVWIPFLIVVALAFMYWQKYL